MRPRITLVVLLGSALLAGLQDLRLSSELPLRVASHFGADGRANGWMSRGAFVAFYAAVVVLLTFSLSRAGSVIERQPDAKINLPNKAYWLDPVRRQATSDWVRSWLHLVGAAVNVLLMRVMHLVARANLTGTGRIDDSINWLIGVFVIFVTGMMVWMTLHFRRRPAD